MNGSSTILLVESELSTAATLLSGLRDERFRALHATDGRQGLRDARAAQPNLVLLEALLPRMDGLAVCRSLREESLVPIIMLSPNGHAMDRIKGLEMGADDVVARPFDPSTGSGRRRLRTGFPGASGPDAGAAPPARVGTPAALPAG